MPVAGEITALATASLEDDKAQDIVTINLSGKTSFADFMIIATGRSDRQVGAMAEHLVEKLKAAGLHSVPSEGMEHRDWVLLDAGDVVIHLFRREVREFYNLEKIWGTNATAAGAKRKAELIA